MGGSGVGIVHGAVGTNGRQLWEAKRLAAWGDIAHGRLALLLLDNAAEMSLMRTAHASLIYAEMYNNMAYLLRDVEPDDEMGQDLKKKTEAGTISKRRKKQIAHPKSRGN
jgi:hypothetical protein